MGRQKYPKNANEVIVDEVVAVEKSAMEWHYEERDQSPQSANLFIERSQSLASMPVRSFLFGLIFCACVCAGFVYETTVVLGGRTFTEKFEQPWFRYSHRSHPRVEAAEKDSSAFGKHFVPEDDVFVPPDWTADETKYLPCLDRKCVCPYFGGKVVGNKCILKNGKTLGKAKRQEIRTLSDEKRKMWEDSLNKLKKSGTYNRLSRTHKYSGVHSGPAFTIWHREFLKRIEMVIRRHLDDVHMGVPYWDSSLDSMLPEPTDSIIFSDLFLGETNEEGHVINGPYANWTTMEGLPHITRKFGANRAGELLNEARIQWLAYNDDINMVLGTTMPLTTCPMNHTLDARMLEYSHDYVHFFIDGDMGSSHSSSNDVIFIYHHSMIDSIFEMWRQNMQTRSERITKYPESHPDCFPYWHNYDNAMPMLQPFKNKDALSNGYTDEIYEFAERPTCTKTSRDCGSKYLFCFVPEDGTNPYCMSKVKKGGNCSGFEAHDICFNSTCINDRCEVRKEASPILVM